MATYTEDQLRHLVQTAANSKPPPTWMVERQIEIESGFKNDLVSSTGCVGLAQIDPRFCRDPGFGIAPCLDPLNPSLATIYLCDYLVAARKRFHNSWGRALLAYNVGMGGDQKTASYAYKQLANYVDSVFSGPVRVS